MRLNHGLSVAGPLPVLLMLLLASGWLGLVAPAPDLSAAAAAPPAAAATAVTGQPEASNPARNLAHLSEQSVSLRSIFERQAELEHECDRYKAKKAKQAERLMKFNEARKVANSGDLLSISVPAICLLLWSQGGTNERATSESGTRARTLDLVNWVYPDESIFRRPPASNVSKREVDPSLSTWPPPVGADSDYLNEEILDIGQLDKQAEGSLNEVESANERAQIEALLNDPDFKETIARNKDRIAASLSPVVLVPGFGGSQLEARYKKKNRVNILCPKSADIWQSVWVDWRLFLPFAVDCWLDNIRLEVDPKTLRASAPSGVQVRAAHFGKVESVTAMDPSQAKLSAYMSTIVEIYSNIGYTPDVNLLAAPYDFRLSPIELEAGGYFERTRKLIESARQRQANGQRVTLVCHSMGCPLMLVFLREQGANWRNKNIRKLISMGAPWGGTTFALKGLFIGENMAVPLLSSNKMKVVAQNFPSFAFLAPQPGVFTRSNSMHADEKGPVLVQVGLNETYNGDQIEQLFEAAGMKNQLRWYQRMRDLVKPFEPIKDLRVDCLYSLNVPTIETILYRDPANFPFGESEMIMGQGDGTVNADSLSVCADWAGQLPELVKYKIFYNIKHRALMSHKPAIMSIIEDILLSTVEKD